VNVVDFLHDPVDDGPRVAVHLTKVISDAKTSIVIESPYIIPSRRFLTLLERKSKEGVYVQLVTNSLRSTDGLLPQAAYLKYRRRLARAGIDVREYKGPDPLHAKSVVIDGRIALIGSYNLSNRSEHLNTEVMCLAEDEDVAQALLESIDTHLQNAWRIRGNGKPSRVERYPLVSRAKVIRAWAARLIVPIVEGQM
jgi:cardiolipin synthase C